MVADEPELGPIGGGEQSHDGKSNGMTEQVIQVAPRVRQVLRPITRAPIRSGMIATITLSPKW